MNGLVRKTKMFMDRNSATILTVIGGIGVVATAVMTAKATPKALTKLEEAKEEKGEELTRMETIGIAAKTYVPAIITGAATISCIFGANALNKRRQAALLSAYALLDNSYKEYKKKIIEMHGEEFDSVVREEIAKDKHDEKEEIPDNGEVLFYDEMSQRYFNSTLDKVKIAECELNKLIARDEAAYLNEFYDFLGIENVDYGNALGWSITQIFEDSWQTWINIECQKVVMDDGLECYIMSTSPVPVADFLEY